MNILLFDANDRIDEHRIRVEGERLTHLRTVLGSQPGEQVRVGELGGLLGDALICSISEQAAELEVSLSQKPPAKLPLRLVLALPRPKMLRRILRSVAEMGVAELHLINSYRVEKSYWQSPVMAPGAADRYLREGLAQSRDTVLPALQCHTRFKPFVEDVLPALLAERRALVAHPGDYPPCPRGLEGATLLAIGPEGGWIPYEVEKLADAGCEPVSLGPRILRVENAVNSLLGRLF